MDNISISCPGKEKEMSAILSEGCGCGGNQPSMGDAIESIYGMDDYSLDTMLQKSRPDRNFSRLRASDDHKHKSHKGSSYMARPQLAKIAKYSEKLLSMVGEGEELQDWQESKIAQMSQIIGDLYHSIEWKQYKD
jgi:hypothetical protein